MIYLICIVLCIAFSVWYFSKHPFVSTDAYPMKFHSFFLKFFIPFEIAIHFADALVEVSNGKAAAFIFQFTLGALYSWLFVKLSKLEKPSYKLIFGMTVINYGLNFLATILLFHSNDPDFDYVSVIGSLIWFGFSIYCFLYYHQRRDIFSAKETVPAISNPQSGIEKGTISKQAFYCRKCGAPIPADSIFCPNCGEKI